MSKCLVPACRAEVPGGTLISELLCAAHLEQYQVAEDLRFGPDIPFMSAQIETFLADFVRTVDAEMRNGEPPKR